MIVHIYADRGDGTYVEVRTEEREPEHEHDRCDICGDCLCAGCAGYGADGDECFTADDGEHCWIDYLSPAASARALGKTTEER